MATEKTRAPKRKSLESSEQAPKKVKVAKSADRPQPVKSALKGSKAAKPIASKAVPEKEPKALDFDDEEEEGALTADQTAALLAGFSSSDEDEDEDDGIAVDKLPKPPKPAGTEVATTDAPADPEATPGVVYIGRLPHGFYEKQMRAYFSQFGDITHLKMPRNKKTGRSKHYAFIEFASSSVAEIVAKTMDKYLLFNHILRVQTIPSDHIKEGMWKGEGKRKRPMPRNKLEGAQLRRGTDVEGWTQRVNKENKKRRSQADKLKELGYEFEMPLIKAVPMPALDTPTLEKGAEQQLLDDVAHAADEQSNEVDLQPEVTIEPAVKSKKRSTEGEDKKTTKRNKSKK